MKKLFAFSLMCMAFLPVSAATSYNAVSKDNACALYMGNRPDDLKLVACIETFYEINACNFDSAVRWWPREMDSRAIYKELLFGENTDCYQMPETFPEE